MREHPQREVYGKCPSTQDALAALVTEVNTRIDELLLNARVSALDSVRQGGVNSGVEPVRYDQAAFGVI